MNITMSVVNVKVAHLRPRYNNLKQWMENPANVYIGRRGIVFIDEVRFPPYDSIWANPFKIDTDSSRDDVIAKYRTYIIGRLYQEPALRLQLLMLKGKTLGCWCHPEPCHGDVLLSLIDPCERGVFGQIMTESTPIYR